MKASIVLFYLLLALNTKVIAAVPSDDSINELMIITNSKEMLSDNIAESNKIMDGMIQKRLKGRQVNQAEQEVIDNTKRKMLLLFDTVLKWEVIEPNIRKIYKESFSQEEIDAMIVFYKSPSGQALIKKMPLVMQNTMTFMETAMESLIPQIKQIEKEFTAEMKEKKQN